MKIYLQVITTRLCWHKKVTYSTRAMRLKFDNKVGIKESLEEMRSFSFSLVGARTKVLNQNNLMIIFACNSTVAHSFSQVSLHLLVTISGLD